MPSAVKENWFAKHCCRLEPCNRFFFQKELTGLNWPECVKGCCFCLGAVPVQDDARELQHYASLSRPGERVKTGIRLLFLRGSNFRCRQVVLTGANNSPPPRTRLCKSVVFWLLSWHFLASLGSVAKRRQGQHKII